MSVVAFSILGLSETLSVVLVFVLGVLVIPVGFFALEWLEMRILGRNLDPEHPPRVFKDGVVLADWVDDERLSSIAKQKGLEPEPTHVERNRMSSKGRELGAGARAMRGRLSRERQHEEREVFDIERDPNTVLAKVLERLETDSELDYTVDKAPPITLDDATLGRIRDVAQGESEEHALAGLRDRLTAAEKRRELEGLAQRRVFVLVESEWSVTHSDGTAILILQTFQPPPYPYDGPEGRTMLVPDGISIAAQLPVDSLDARAKRRLDDQMVLRAGVLATVASYTAKSGELELAPIAIFNRLGKQGADHGMSYGC